MSVGLKLSFTFGLILLALAGASYSGIKALQRVSNTYEEVLESEVSSMLLARELEAQLYRMSAASRGYVLSPNPVVKQDYEEARSFVVETYSGAGLREFEEWLPYVDRAIAQTDAGMYGDALMSIEAAMSRFQPLLERIAELTATMQRGMNEARVSARNAASTGQIQGIYSSIIAVVLGFLFTFFLTRSITRPLALVTETAKRIASGDLTVERLNVRQRDEIGIMSDAFNMMVENLRTLIRQVAASSEDLSASSEELAATAEQAANATKQIAATIEQVAQGAADQSRSVQDTASVVDELKRSIHRIAQGAEQQARAVQEMTSVMGEMTRALATTAERAAGVSDLAKKALQTARDGENAVRETVAGMRQIHETVSQTARNIQELGSHSEKVGEIVQVISGIADQTNLLALNAAIEAARAGEHGKGFAVVADEVRKLAERSAASAGEIAQLIGSMQHGIGRVVASMNEGTAKVQVGLDLAQRAGGALDEILSALQSTTDGVNDIARYAEENRESVKRITHLAENLAGVSEENSASAEEMAARSDQVTSAIESISAVSEQTAASSEEVSASAEEMNSSVMEISRSVQQLTQMAAELQERVSKFRV